MSEVHVPYGAAAAGQEFGAAPEGATIPGGGGPPRGSRTVITAGSATPSTDQDPDSTDSLDRLGPAEEPSPYAPKLDVLVLDAAARQALVTVRSLGRRNLSVGAMDTIRYAPAFSSRWCRTRFSYPAQHGTAAYLAVLEGALDSTDAPLVIPSHDGTIALLREHRDALERRVRIALAGEPALSIAVNKARTLAVAEELGIPMPQSLRVTRPSELPAALDAIGLPAVVKPCESWVGGDGHGARFIPRLVTSADEAGRAFADLARHGGDALLQEFVGGRREAVSLLYANHTVYARFAQWAQRTVPPLGGDSVLRQSVPVPHDIGDAAERLIRAIDLEGYSEVEFRRNAAGTPYLMEINPRLSASVEIAVRSGVDFPFLLWQWATGGPIDHVDRYRTGGWMRYLGGDVRGTLQTIHQRGRPGIPAPGRAALDFASAFLRPMSYDYLDWQDLLPALHATASFCRRTLTQVLRQENSTFTRDLHEQGANTDTSAASAPRTT